MKGGFVNCDICETGEVELHSSEKKGYSETMGILLGNNVIKDLDCIGERYNYSSILFSSSSSSSSPSRDLLAALSASSRNAFGTSS